MVSGQIWSSDDIKTGLFFLVFCCWFFFFHFTSLKPPLTYLFQYDWKLFFFPRFFFLFNHWNKQKPPMNQCTLLVEHACEHVDVYFQVRRCAGQTKACWQKEDPCICLAQICQQAKHTLHWSFKMKAHTSLWDTQIQCFSLLTMPFVH